MRSCASASSRSKLTRSTAWSCACSCCPSHYNCFPLPIHTRNLQPLFSSNSCARCVQQLHEIAMKFATFAPPPPSSSPIPPCHVVQSCCFRRVLHLIVCLCFCAFSRVCVLERPLILCEQILQRIRRSLREATGAAAAAAARRIRSSRTIPCSSICRENLQKDAPQHVPSPPPPLPFPLPNNNPNIYVIV